MPLLLILVGLLLVSTGLAGMFLGGYMSNGEAHKNLAEGVPTLVFGLGSVTMGLLVMVRGVRSLRSKTNAAKRTQGLDVKCTSSAPDRPTPKGTRRSLIEERVAQDGGAASDPEGGAHGA